MSDARSKADRGAIAVVRADTPYESALTRCASSNHAGRRGRFSWPCWRACRALVCPLQRTYSEVTYSIYKWRVDSRLATVRKFTDANDHRQTRRTGRLEVLGRAECDIGERGLSSVKTCRVARAPYNCISWPSLVFSMID